MSPEQCLQQGISRLKLDISAAQQQRLMAYLLLLHKWNQAYNLTAIRNLDEMVIKHLLDSLAVLPSIKGVRCLDVGTGAGLPGLVLALLNPAQHWVLLDSNNKKTRFLQQAVIEFALSNVEVVCSRIELFKPAQPFDVIISRAYSELQKFYQQTRALCAPQGQLIAMKGVYPEQELKSFQLDGIAWESVALDVPFLNAERHLIIFKS
ncbi:MAG: 16S rRNA (guanine(527)-N(7))-methyltransferase RsmG [Thiotrichaceae bacterium]|nr:16S rRNA (guanine(527)-N(7))-methyltransferase RsmG [Thiotrichaceae bacterium]